MSVSIYCQSYFQGNDQQLNVADITGHFEPFIDNKTHEGFKVVYDEQNSCNVFLDLKASKTSDFMISKPCGDKRLFEAIYNCMTLGNVICYNTYNNNFIALSSITLEHLPIDLNEHATGSEANFIVVKDFEEFYQEI